MKLSPCRILLSILSACYITHYLNPLPADSTNLFKSCTIKLEKFLQNTSLPKISNSQRNYITRHASVSDTSDQNGLSKPIGQLPKDNENIEIIFIRQSSVLLPSGQIEIEVGSEYKRAGRELTVLSTRYREFALPLTLRIGIFGRAEGFVSIPISFLQEQLFFSENKRAQSKFGIGDTLIGLKVTLLAETERCPEIIAAANLVGPTGGKPIAGRLSLGSGHWGATLGLTFIKTSDPLALFWGCDYTGKFGSTHFYNDGVYKVQPGKAFGYNFGFGFAVNEKISLSNQLTGVYRMEDKVNDRIFDGSSQESLLVRTGLTFSLSRRTYIEQSVTIGLTDDSPDAVIGISWIHRLNKL